MADSYTSKFRWRLMEDGSHINTWGAETNETYALIEDAISGAATITSTGGSYSLTANNDAADEARMAILIFDATLASNLTVTIPSTSKQYIVKNDTTGSYTLTIKTASGSGVLVAQGAITNIVCDGTDCFSISPDRLSSDVIGNDKVISQVTLKDIGETEFALGTAGVIYAGTITPDYENGAIQYGTLVGNIILELPTNFPSSGGVLLLYLKQDATGGRTITVNSSYLKTDTITLSTDANKIDKLFISKTNGNYDITLNAGYA
jgi:predicted ATP-grasp superfamily ATP-dependent carboligase